MNGVSGVNLEMWLLPNFKRKSQQICKNGSLWQFAVESKSKLRLRLTKFVMFHVIHDEKVGLDLKNPSLMKFWGLGFAESNQFFLPSFLPLLVNKKKRL